MANEIVVDAVQARRISLIFIYDLAALGITKVAVNQSGGDKKRRDERHR